MKQAGSEQGYEINQYHTSSPTQPCLGWGLYCGLVQILEPTPSLLDDMTAFVQICRFGKHTCESLRSDEQLCHLVFNDPGSLSSSSIFAREMNNMLPPGHSALTELHSLKHFL